MTLRYVQNSVNNLDYACYWYSFKFYFEWNLFIFVGNPKLQNPIGKCFAIPPVCEIKLGWVQCSEPFHFSMNLNHTLLGDGIVLFLVFKIIKINTSFIIKITDIIFIKIIFYGPQLKNLSVGFVLPNTSYNHTIKEWNQSAKTNFYKPCKITKSIWSAWVINAQTINESEVHVNKLHKII